MGLNGLYDGPHRGWLGPYGYPRTESDYRDFQRERKRIRIASKAFDDARPVYDRALDAPARRYYVLGLDRNGDSIYGREVGVKHSARLARERREAGIGL